MHAFRPAEPHAYLGGDAVACDLARQAIYWALCAHHDLATTAPPEPPEVGSADRFDFALERLWNEAEPELLARAAGNPRFVEPLRLEVIGKSFLDFADLDRRTQAELAERLHAFAARLLEPLDTQQREAERLWLWRAARVVGLFLLLTGFIAASYGVKNWWELRRDRAAGASWTTSSAYGGTCACKSPEQVCSECPNFFFHTTEERNPSIVFDLGREQQFSTISVENRRDCCPERGLPLVVQVSSDGKHWTEVARRESQFSSWRQAFPTTRARWLKLYVPRRGILHLARVRLLP